MLLVLSGRFAPRIHTLGHREAGAGRIAPPSWMNPGGGRHQRRCSDHEPALRDVARLASVRDIFGDDAA
jgi:hypothetical protein